MQCINKIKAGFTESGDLTFSKKKASKSIVGFEFECRKCLPCRLNIAREKSIRAMHESYCHKENIFLTLTYSDEHLRSPALVYADFQDFMKRLRELHTRNVTDRDLRNEMAISYMVTGEYGDKNKRPHWHAIIFNYSPPDKQFHRTTDLGHVVYKSKIIDELWGKNDPEKVPNEIGSVDIDSAGYVARYAAKKLTHGNDQDHNYHPIHKTSSKHAIGRRWIEKNYKQVFELGFVRLPNGQPTRIPRYYTDWLKKHHPEEWRTYVTQKRLEIQEQSSLKARNEEIEYWSQVLNRPFGFPMPTSRKKAALSILKHKFKKLMEHITS